MPDDETIAILSAEMDRLFAAIRPIERTFANADPGQARLTALAAVNVFVQLALNVTMQLEIPEKTLVDWLRVSVKTRGSDELPLLMLIGHPEGHA